MIISTSYILNFYDQQLFFKTLKLKRKKKSLSRCKTEIYKNEQKDKKVHPTQNKNHNKVKSIGSLIIISQRPEIHAQSSDPQ